MKHYSKDSIAIIWHIDDVLEVRPDITRDQARQVLGVVEHLHNANIDINWDVLEATADTLFPIDTDE